MTELRNVEADLWRFRTRVVAAGAVVVICFSLLVARLIYLQVVRHEDLAEQAENNRTAVVPIVPNRGLIVDRNGVVLATNYSAYTLEITPSKAGPLDEVIDGLATVVDIQARDRRRFKKLVEESKSFESLPIRTRLSDEEVARFAAQRFRFPGVEIKARLFRNYPYGPLASHVIGYIGRVNQKEKEDIQDSDDEANYRGTEYIGKLGVEQSFERQLHGITAVAPWWRSTPRPARCWPSSASPPSIPTCSWTASIRRTGPPSTSHPTSPCGAGPCAAPTRRAPLTSPSWPWPPWRRERPRPSRPSLTRAISCTATTASATTRNAVTARWTCTSRSCSRATPTTTCWPTTWAWT